jgi:hypothetical protein
LNTANTEEKVTFVANPTLDIFVFLLGFDMAVTLFDAF